jgi:AAA+ ATPase superfamily predicted ATPase
LKNKDFIGRKHEIARLEAFIHLPRAGILVVYGRRRIGKTEMIEQTFRDRHILKFEGLERQNQADQITQVLYQAAQYFEQPYIAKLNFTSWVEVLDLIADHSLEQEITLYFEELQWLANYEDKFISALKFVWDNKLRHNPKLRVVLCGSSPSFMINQVIHSKALYNRSLYEMHLEPLSLSEMQLFLPKLSHQEIVLAGLTLGGIPEYLQYIRDSPSVFLGLCKNSFIKDSMFSREYERIFISSLNKNPYYQKIIHYLSLRRFATREEITKHLNIKSGGSITLLLNDLEQCGFIEKYQPYYLHSARGLYRYCIRDQYLMFYYKFIDPIQQNIQLGQYNAHPERAINLQSYHIWMGYAFERLIRHNQHHIAKILGIDGLPYRWGVFYNRETAREQPGYQIDLLFEHSQHVFTICEIKYHTDLVGPTVITDMEQKLALFPNDKKQTIKKVLITTLGATQSLIDRAYFDRMITIDDLFVSKP